MQENTEKISIIMRIYNGEETLRRAIESVLAQSYPNFEIVAVDDGSSDKSASIAEEYASRQPERVKVIRVGHKGIFEATRIGVKNASGTLVGFVDADDYVKPEMYRILLEAMKKYKCEIAQCESYTFINPDGELTEHQKIGQEVYYERLQAMENLVGGKSIVRYALCYKLYRKELFKKIEWVYSSISEDIGITYQLLHFCTGLVCVPDMLYCTYKNPNSLTRSAFKPEKYDRFLVYDRMRNFFTEHSEYRELIPYALESEIGVIYKAVADAYSSPPPPPIQSI